MKNEAWQDERLIKDLIPMFLIRSCFLLSGCKDKNMVDWILFFPKKRKFNVIEVDLTD